MINTVGDLIKALREFDSSLPIRVEDDVSGEHRPVLQHYTPKPMTTGADFHRVGTTREYVMIEMGEEAQIPWDKLTGGE